MICPCCKGEDNPTYEGRRVCKDCLRKQKKKRRNDNWSRLAKYKEDTPCMDCGISYPSYVMQYDHRPGEVKRRAVSDMVSLEVTWETILTEIVKCDLVCANCHSVRTHIRKTP